MTSRSATNAKKLIPIATPEIPDRPRRLPLDHLKNSKEIEESPKKKIRTEPHEPDLIQKDPTEKPKGLQEGRDDTNISKWSWKWISIFTILVGVGSLFLLYYFWQFGIPESLKSTWKKENMAEKIPVQDHCTFKEYMAKSFESNKPVRTIDEGVRNGVTTAVDEIMWKKAKIGGTRVCKFGIPERLKKAKIKIPFQDQCKFSPSSCTFEEHLAKMQHKTWVDRRAINDDLAQNAVRTIDKGVRHDVTTAAAGEGNFEKLLRRLAKYGLVPMFTLFAPVGVAFLCLLCLRRLFRR